MADNKTKMIENGAAPTQADDLERLRPLVTGIVSEVLSHVLPAMLGTVQAAVRKPTEGSFPKSDGRPKTVRLRVNSEVVYDNKKYEVGQEFDCDAENAELFTREYPNVYPFSGLRSADAADAQLGKSQTCTRIGAAQQHAVS